MVYLPVSILLSSAELFNVPELPPLALVPLLNLVQLLESLEAPLAAVDTGHKPAPVEGGVVFLCRCCCCSISVFLQVIKNQTVFKDLRNGHY